MVTAACEVSEVELYATHRSEREDWVQGMVMAGMGFAFFPEFSVVVEGIRCRPLVDPQVHREVGAVALEQPEPAPAVAAFLGEAANWHWDARPSADRPRRR